MYKFWNWTNSETEGNILYLNGVIAEESWFEDEVSPQLFKEELEGKEGDITVWINSPGGDCIAAAQIYNMIKQHKGNVTVKIDGLAASAASVIAMAGHKVYMSPVSMIMIHDPSTMAYGNPKEIQKVVEMLSEVKESIINAYEIKTGLPRKKISNLMEAETWMSAGRALDLGFIDGILNEEDKEDKKELKSSDMLFSRVKLNNSIMEKLKAKSAINKSVSTETNLPEERKADDLMERLNIIKKHI